MDKELLLKSLVLGLSIAAPVGPIGILCIRRSLVDGRIAGLVCGLGAATADSVYGALGAFALNGISAWLVRGRLWMTLAGSAFLLYLGVKIFRAPAPETTATAAGSASGAYVSTFLLTLANPLTILSFAAAFAGMGAGAGGYGGIITMLVGVFVGSAIWWLMLTSVAGAARGRLTPPFFVAINRVSGALLTGSGLYTVMRLVS